MRLESVALLNGFVANFVSTKLTSRAAAAPDPARTAAESARLGELLASGRYPRFAAAIAAGGPPATDLSARFERLLDRIMDGLIQSGSPAPGADS